MWNLKYIQTYHTLLLLLFLIKFIVLFIFALLAQIIFFVATLLSFAIVGLIFAFEVVKVLRVESVSVLVLVFIIVLVFFFVNHHSLYCVVVVAIFFSIVVVTVVILFRIFVVVFQLKRLARHQKSFVIQARSNASLRQNFFDSFTFHYITHVYITHGFN